MLGGSVAYVNSLPNPILVPRSAGRVFHTGDAVKLRQIFILEGGSLG